LENALGGDSNICVICTLSGEEDHHAETLETLKFAGNCARVETKAKKNIVSHKGALLTHADEQLMSSEQALIKAKDKEIEILRRRLEGLVVKDDGQSEGSVNADQVQNVRPVIGRFADSQLADSVAAMEARKNRLHTQLAKLNTQVLTSELPRAGHGVPSLPSGPKRRRISDLYSVMGASRVGLGSPKQKALDNRRAVSSALRMPQVLEDEMPAIHTQLEGVGPKVSLLILAVK
jgi:centromeric protein E